MRRWREGRQEERRAPTAALAWKTGKRHFRTFAPLSFNIFVLVACDGRQIRLVCKREMLGGAARTPVYRRSARPPQCSMPYWPGSAVFLAPHCNGALAAGAEGRSRRGGNQPTRAIAPAPLMATGLRAGGIEANSCPTVDRTPGSQSATRLRSAPLPPVAGSAFAWAAPSPSRSAAWCAGTTGAYTACSGDSPEPPPPWRPAEARSRRIGLARSASRDRHGGAGESRGQGARHSARGHRHWLIGPATLRPVRFLFCGGRQRRRSRSRSSP